MLVRYVVGVSLIAGVLGALWVAYGPRTPDPELRAPVVRLAAADAVVRVRVGSKTRQASISCDGDRRRASGFWAKDPVQACDALASTRGALLSGPGCARAGRSRVTSRGDGLVRRPPVRTPCRPRPLPGPGRLARGQRAGHTGAQARPRARTRGLTGRSRGLRPRR